MIPATFEYIRAGSVEEAVDALVQHGDEAKLLAGGHSLLPLMKLRLADPEVVSDGERYTTLAKQHAELAEVVAAYRRWRETTGDIDAALEMLPEIEEELLARGDVRFEFHHLPLRSIHANAAPAAEAAECVFEESGVDGFWEYHDALFERQRAWSGLGDPYPYFARLAGELGLEGERVGECLDENRFAAEIDAAYRYAAGDLGLNSTPTLLLNGYRVGDSRDISAYLDLIELITAFAEE